MYDFPPKEETKPPLSRNPTSDGATPVTPPDNAEGAAVSEFLNRTVSASSTSSTPTAARTSSAVPAPLTHPWKQRAPDVETPCFVCHKAIPVGSKPTVQCSGARATRAAVQMERMAPAHGGLSSPV